jgi:hypothetical protein
MTRLIRQTSEIGSLNLEPQKKSDRLSIQLRLDGFSFCISNPPNQTVLYLSEYNIKLSQNEKYNWQKLTNGLEEWVLNSKIKTDSFDDVVLYLDTKAYTLVPSSFNLIENDREQLLFNQNISYDFVSLRNNISGTKQDLIFALPSSLNDAFEIYFNGKKAEHALLKLHNILFKNKRNKKTGSRVYAYVSNRDLHILVYNNENPVFINSYVFKTKEDFIYFILLIYEQNGLNTDETPLFLLGDISFSSLLYSISYQYIRTIEILKNSDGINLYTSDIDYSFFHKHHILVNSAL